MTRQECLNAVSIAFGGAETWAVVGAWEIKIKTSPPRAIIMSADWVEKNIQLDGAATSGMTQDELKVFLGGVPDSQWITEEDGSRSLLFLKADVNEIYGAEYDVTANDSLLSLATLPKYLHNPAFTDRLITSAGQGETCLPRTEYYPKEKKISLQELREGGYHYFFDRQASYAEDFEERLCEEVPEIKVKTFITAIKEFWVDGSTARQYSPEMLQIKASIRDHDRWYFPQRNVFVNSANRVAESVSALFDPDEMHSVFEITSRLATTCVEDYLESRFKTDLNSISINNLYLHRGILPAKMIDDSLLVEEHYLSSYSMTVTVPEVFAQTWSSASKGGGEPTMLAAPFPLFNNRIVVFAPLIQGMSLGQLEVCVAPPLEPLPLEYQGHFESGQPGLSFHEYEFDSLKPGERWTGPLPDRIIKFVS